MYSNKGFSLIEVLIALIIIAIAIITLNTIFKQYSSYRQKQSKYERIYISVLSLKDRISNLDLSRVATLNGIINGLHYNVRVNKIIGLRNFVYRETKQGTGNYGKFMIFLYKVTLTVDNREFSFYETRYR